MFRLIIDQMAACAVKGVACIVAEYFITLYFHILELDRQFRHQLQKPAGGKWLQSKGIFLQEVVENKTELKAK